MFNVWVDRYRVIIPVSDKWIIVLVYTKPVNSPCQKKNIIWSKLGCKGDYSRASICFANQLIVQHIWSLSSQSERAKKDIRWFGIY